MKCVISCHLLLDTDKIRNKKRELFLTPFFTISHGENNTKI